MTDELRAIVRDAISQEWHRRIAGQIAATPDEHIDAHADAVVARLVAERPAEVFEEWRVTGEPGHGYPPYHFVWSPERGSGTADPEGAARKFMALVTAEHREPWVDGPHLTMRTVTRTAWRGAAAG